MSCCPSLRSLRSSHDTVPHAISRSVEALRRWPRTDISVTSRSHGRRMGSTVVAWIGDAIRPTRNRIEGRLERESNRFGEEKIRA